MRSGKWRFKPSGKLPIFMRYIINSAFTKEIAKKSNIHHPMSNRTYVNHIMFWPAAEYNLFEDEIIGYLKADDGWYEKYCKRQLKMSEHLYNEGLRLKRVNWVKKSNKQIAKEIDKMVQKSRELACPWYAQYPLDEYFEEAIEKKLSEFLPTANPEFRKYVLTFSEAAAMTEVSEERLKLLKMVKTFIKDKEKFDNLSKKAEKKIKKHLEKFAYINCGLGTSQAYTREDVVKRLREIKDSTGADIKKIDKMIYNSAGEKIKEEYRLALKKLKPAADFKKLIEQARWHSYVRNRRVEAFFNVVYGIGLAQAEMARRFNFRPEWIMEISVPETLDVLLKNKPLPSDQKMFQRLKDYAMVVRDSVTSLITDPEEIERLKQVYVLEMEDKKELKGNVACLGGIIQGRAKICLDKSDIGKVERGDILVANFTTPDFVPAMEKAAAIVTDQGGLSSHAAIVSRELGVPCVIATKEGTRLIKNGDLLEVDAKSGIVKIIERV